MTTHRRKGTFRAQAAERSGRAAQRTPLPPRCCRCRQGSVMFIGTDPYCRKHGDEETDLLRKLTDPNITKIAMNDLIDSTRETVPGRVRLQPLATEVHIGDIVQLGEVDWIVREIKRVDQSVSSLVPDEIHAQGGWVSLVGDTADGYFDRFYGGAEDYYAAPDQRIVVFRDGGPTY